MESIKAYLREFRHQAVELIVARAIIELPDYALREPTELRKAVERSYDNWCESVLTNDFSHSLLNSQKAIEQGLAQGIEPGQLARTPWLICEVVLELLLASIPAPDPTEHAEFTLRANRLTTQMGLVGQFKIKRSLL